MKLRCRILGHKLGEIKTVSLMQHVLIAIERRSTVGIPDVGQKYQNCVRCKQYRLLPVEGGN